MHGYKIFSTGCLEFFFVDCVESDFVGKPVVGAVVAPEMIIIPVKNKGLSDITS